MRNLFNRLLLLSYLLLLTGCLGINADFEFLAQNPSTLNTGNIETGLKVANLEVDQTEFDFMYNNFDQEIEIDALLSVYKGNELLIDKREVEIEIKGNYSASFDLKQIGVKFQSSYNNKSRDLIDAPNLPFHSLDFVKAFRFRNSGNDFVYTMIRDISFTELARQAQLDLDIMYTEQVVVFINDRFYGLMNMRTESNANGMARLYEVKKGDITLGKVVFPGVVERKNGDRSRIDRFLEAIENQELSFLKSQIDLANFIDYMIFESYLGHWDWPNNNVRFYAIDDGPFRFVLFDLDQAVKEDIGLSPMFFIQREGQSPIRDLFNLLYSDAEFKEAYDNRFKSLINSGVLSPQRFNSIVDNYMTRIEHLMPTQIEKYNQPGTMALWYWYVNKLKQNFQWRVEAIQPGIADN